MAAAKAVEKIRAEAFYGNYHGHTLAHLARLAALWGITPPKADGTESPGRPRVLWLCGDSSLDNKHWILSSKTDRAANGMDRVISPARSVCDVAHFLNVLAERENAAADGAATAAAAADAEAGVKGGAGGSPTYRPWVVVNAAVEESTLGARTPGVVTSVLGGDTPLLPQDEFLRDHLGPHDAICVSAGGNDVALRPTPATIACMLSMVRCGSLESIRAGTAWGVSHFMGLFGRDMQGYVNALTAKVAPAAVGVCSIYFPDERATGGWADGTLGALQYDSEPAKLQAAITLIHERATSTVRACPSSGHTRTVAIRLSEVLDGKHTEDYVARVEPSVSGGRKMAELIWRDMRLNEARRDERDGDASSGAATGAAGGAGSAGAAAGAGGSDGPSAATAESDVAGAAGMQVDAAGVADDGSGEALGPGKG